MKCRRAQKSWRKELSDMAILFRVGEVIYKSALTASILALCGLVLVVLLQIIARYIFSSPPGWTEEAGRYLMIWSGLLGAAAAYWEMADPVLRRLPSDAKPWKQKAVTLAEFSAVSTFCVPLFFYGLVHSHFMLNIPSDTIGVALGIVTAIIPIFSCLIFVLATLRLALRLMEPGEES